MLRGGGIKIGRILGIPIYLNSSWFFIFALIAYSLTAEFSLFNSSWTQAQCWSLGLGTSLLFFASVLFHELSHSVVALRYRIPVASITLFIFGGVARITREPDRAGQEFLIAAAGPLSSFLLAGGFGLLWMLSPPATMVAAVTLWLARINLVLAVFNLVPGFPLDGGRILRSIVWGITKSYNRSTRIAARSGQVIAYGMIGLGLWLALQGYSDGGDVMGGLWLAFIGWFLLSAARMSYAQVATSSALEGLRVSDIMSAELPAVGRAISLEEYGQVVARTGRRAHLVVADGQLVGLMTLETLQAVPREEWPMTSVQAAMHTRERLHWTAPEEPVISLLDRMRNVEVDQMAVVNEGNVIGLVTRDSIQRVIETRHHIGHMVGR